MEVSCGGYKKISMYSEWFCKMLLCFHFLYFCLFLSLDSSSLMTVFTILVSIAPFCNALMQTLESNPVTKIVWNSVKPLLMGKILYTPDSPAVRKILKSVRETTSSPTPHLSLSFVLFTSLYSLFHSFSISFNTLSICLCVQNPHPS